MPGSTRRRALVHPGASGQLERALDVLARSLIVALAAVHRERQAKMFRRSRSDGSSERSTRASASLKSPTAVEMLASRYRQTPSR